MVEATSNQRVLLVAAALRPDNMESHVVETLRAMGNEVYAFNADLPIQLPGKAAMYATTVLRVLHREPERLIERRLLEAVEAFQPSLILVLLGSSLSPKTVARIKNAYSVPIVCWHQDALINLGRQYLIGAHYDHVFVKDEYILGFMTDMVGHPSVHLLPEACNPRVHRPIRPSPREQTELGADISTFGTLYYYRQSILEALYEFDLKIWGPVPSWLVQTGREKHMGRSVVEDEKCKVIQASKITLNTLHFSELNGLNCRAFEVAGCRGFQLMSHSPVVSRYFDVDKEVVTFRTRRELVEKVRHYLDRPEERALIADAGFERATREHTYEGRLTYLLRVSLSPGK